MVRCAHCAHQWFEQAPELAEVAVGGGHLAGAPFDTARLDNSPRDDVSFNDPRFEVDPHAAGTQPGYDAAPPGWEDPIAQWSAEPTDPVDVVQFADDEIEFAPPSEVEAIDDAPSTAPRYPGDVDGDERSALANAGTAGHDAQGSEGEPDYFEIQRRRKSRVTPKKAANSLFTIPRLIAALAALIAVLVFERYNIVRLMPQTASLYAVVGLPINLRGLVFEDVKTITEMQDSVPVLVIEGVIRNVTRDNADVPRLRFAMRNSAGADIYSWTAVPDRQSLTPGGVVGFRTRLASPPPESRSAYVRFVQRRDLTTISR
jgi:hypothetical protein